MKRAVKKRAVSKKKAGVPKNPKFASLSVEQLEQTLHEVEAELEERIRDKTIDDVPASVLKTLTKDFAEFELLVSDSFLALVELPVNLYLNVNSYGEIDFSGDDFTLSPKVTDEYLLKHSPTIANHVESIKAKRKKIEAAIEHAVVEYGVPREEFAEFDFDSLF